ncbi:MAG: hypothetical protein IJ692_05865 [Alloprevotella sp.]|nr:hypothetical protein [Alloprevotella sp.]MBR1652900.1 hypothetical protein [Alloprevotella sp.]
MKKALLLTVSCLFAASLAAQGDLSMGNNASPFLGKYSVGSFFSRHPKAPRRAAEGPTAYYSRPEGLLFFGMSYRAIHARNYAFAPAGMDITYRGTAQGEKMEWEYDTEYNEDGSPLTTEFKTFTKEDTTLTVNYVDGGYFAPILRATNGEGEAAVDSTYYIVPSRIWTKSATGEIFGSETEMYDIPVGNYNGRYFNFLDNGYEYLATNNPTSDANIARGFGLQSAHVGGFYEMMPLMNGAPCVIYGADAIIYAEKEPALSDIVIEVLETMDGELLGDEPLSVLRAGAVNKLNYSDGSLMGYGIRFAAPQAFVANGEFALHIVNAEGSELSFSPCLVISSDPDDKVYAYCDFEYTMGGQSGEMLYPIDMFTYQGGSHITGLAAGLIMSYHPYDIEEVQNHDGIAAPQAEPASARAGIFDMQGRKLQAAPLKGVFVKNGKKFVR